MGRENPLRSTPPAQVNSEGVYRYATAKWFHRALASLACSGVRGAAVDVWVRIAPPVPLLGSGPGVIGTVPG